MTGQLDQPKRKTHEILAGQLRDQIASGELVAGQRLPSEDELTAQYGIARTTLREALRVLESQGLLTIRRGRGGGPEVTHPSLEPAATALAVSLQLQGTTMGDLDEARRMIEPHVAGKLASSHTDEDIAALESAIANANDAAEAGDLVGFSPAAVAVHEALMARSGNNTMATISQLLHHLVRAYYAQAARHAQMDQKAMRRAVRSYRKLVNLIQAGDVAGATTHWQAQMAWTIKGNDPNVPLVASTRG
jgi:GntR family transcriptional repressor for pyruvate dehydrogenase complex